MKEHLRFEDLKEAHAWLDTYETDFWKKAYQRATWYIPWLYKRNKLVPLMKMTFDRKKTKKPFIHPAAQDLDKWTEKQSVEFWEKAWQKYILLNKEPTYYYRLRHVIRLAFYRNRFFKSPALLKG